jgi:hypothetical protein
MSKESKNSGEAGTGAFRLYANVEESFVRDRESGINGFPVRATRPNREFHYRADRCSASRF